MVGGLAHILTKGGLLQSKGGHSMLTLAEFVALTGLLITVFSLGYKLGRDSVTKK